MIKSFSDKSTEKLFKRKNVRSLPQSLLKNVYRKLLIIDAAEKISDLRIPPGNRLEKLSEDLAGQYSIRINDQWRITFFWRDNNAYEVEITDYHKG